MDNRISPVGNHREIKKYRGSLEPSGTWRSLSIFRTMGDKDVNREGTREKSGWVEGKTSNEAISPKQMQAHQA